jgi:hypothetical protein
MRTKVLSIHRYLAVPIAAVALLGGMTVGTVAARSSEEPRAVPLRPLDNCYDLPYGMGSGNYNCPPYGCTTSNTHIFLWSDVEDVTCAQNFAGRYMRAIVRLCDGTTQYSGTLTPIGSSPYSSISFNAYWVDGEWVYVAASPCFYEENWPSYWQVYFGGQCIKSITWESGCCQCSDDPPNSL